MDSLYQHFLTATALILVIEGLMYAVFPKQIQKVMTIASDLPQDKLRHFGSIMLLAGVLLIWFFTLNTEI